jgi:hypothetical protein
MKIKLKQANMGIKIPLILIFMITMLSGFSQDPDSTTLTYQGGFKKFDRLIFNEISNSDASSQDSFYKKPFLFYQVIFEVGKNGNIGDVWINSLYDTALFSSIDSAIMKSNGAWTNHTNKKLLVVLPVYYNIVNSDTAGDGTLKEVSERTDNSGSLKISDRYYQKGSIRQVVHLKPMKIVSFTPVN